MRLKIGIVLCAVMLMLFTGGCIEDLFKPHTNPTDNSSVSDQVIETVIHKTDYIFSILIVSVVLGFVATFNGYGKLGVSVIFGSIVGMFLKMMISIMWMYYIAAGMVVIAVIGGSIAIYKNRKALFSKNVALTDLVKLIEVYKGEVKKSGTQYPAYAALKSLLNRENSVTQGEVARIRNENKTDINNAKSENILGI